MGLMSRLNDLVNGRRNTVSQEVSGRLFVNPQCSTAENVFAQVVPLIDEMTSVFPYGIGRNGARLADARTPELNLLKDPNEDMGWAEFANLMFMTWLTETELNIHVHKNRNRIIGYSVLPPNCRVDLGNGEYYYQINTVDGVETLSKDEVAVLRFARNPRNIQRGISPASSVFTYTQIDDVLAQYQKAYFENGAIPASITFITASTKEKYDATRRELEANLHGARNKNKTIYAWRQVLDTGESADQVEVKTIQGNNSTLAIKEINEIVTDRINKAFGVSNFILGDDASAKYDNAELSDRQFTKRRVYPALLKFWSQFQHELDRITGGLGYAISFDLEIPELTDRLKTKAEIAEKNVSNLLRLIEAGASPTATVQALGLGKNWQAVANGIYGRQLEIREAEKIEAEAEENTPLLLEANNQKEETRDHIECTCHKSLDDFNGTFADDEKSEKKIYDVLLKLAEEIASETGNVDYDTAVAEIMEVLQEEAKKGGVEGVERLVNGADEDLKKTVLANLDEKGYVISKDFADRMQRRTDVLVRRYGEYTQDAVMSVLRSDEPLTAGEIKKRLSEVMPKKRAELIARNETIYTYQSAQLDVEKAVADDLDLDVTLVWRARHDSKTCPVCAAMDGSETKLGDSFADMEQTSDGQIVAWEQDEWNDDGQIPHAHPNCRCYYETITRRR